MAEYSQVKHGKLKLKGEKQHKKHKHKKRKHGDEELRDATVSNESTVSHGGWWEVSKFEEIVGSVAVELRDHCYIKALDNGLFTVGAPHQDGDGPDPEEILTALKISESQIALKSGYGKFIGVDKDGVVTGRADAVGIREHWEPVFQDGKLALLASNNCFLSVDSEDTVIARKRTAGPEEVLHVRSQLQRENKKQKILPDEEKGNLKQVEENYVRKFQKFQDKKVLINTESRKDLKVAKDGGKLHEALLDRRAKMKSDRYCK